MAELSSGTTTRLRYKRPGDTLWKTFKNSTTMGDTDNTNFRSLIHKDNPGDHDEVRPDGSNGTSQVSAFHEPQATYRDLKAAKLAKEKLEIQWTTGETGADIYEVEAYIQSISSTAAVRETVTFQVSFTHTSPVVITVVA